MTQILSVVIPEKNNFYTLYSDGTEATKIVVPDKIEFQYSKNSIVYLYYTFPVHRRAYAIRFVGDDTGIILPGLSERVKILIECHASKVDKLKKTVSFLKEHYDAFHLSDPFYYKIGLLIQQQGKVNYESITQLFEIAGEKNGSYSN